MAAYIIAMPAYSKRLSTFSSYDFFGPFFQKLSDSEVFRKNALKPGAVLFTRSFILKLAANLIV